MNLKLIADQTLEALNAGSYLRPEGAGVSIAEALRDCVAATRCYDPDALARIHADVLGRPPTGSATTFEIRNETTLAGCERLVNADGERALGVLNFASARNPGGGFLSGARAQEESLARSSGLYPSLLRCPAYYAYHREHGSWAYSDRMIYSPGCPVFRSDSGEWLSRPYLVNFITSPAPNAGVAAREGVGRDEIAPVIVERSSKLLALAVHHGCEVLVLGAWGCGVFRNDPTDVAAAFYAHLGPGGPFEHRFRRVVFSLLDQSASLSIYTPFARLFAS